MYYIWFIDVCKYFETSLKCNISVDIAQIYMI